MAKKTEASQTEKANQIKKDASGPPQDPRPPKAAPASMPPKKGPRPSPAAPSASSKLDAIVGLREKIRPLQTECEEKRLAHLKLKHEIDEMTQQLFALIDDDGQGTLFADDDDREARAHDES